MELSVLRINCGNGEKGFKRNGCLFPKSSWYVQEENGKLRITCNHILQRRLRFQKYFLVGKMTTLILFWSHFDVIKRNRKELLKEQKTGWTLILDNVQMSKFNFFSGTTVCRCYIKNQILYLEESPALLTCC